MLFSFSLLRSSTTASGYASDSGYGSAGHYSNWRGDGESFGGADRQRFPWKHISETAPCPYDDRIRFLGTATQEDVLLFTWGLITFLPLVLVMFFSHCIARSSFKVSHASEDLPRHAVLRGLREKGQR